MFLPALALLVWRAERPALAAAAVGALALAALVGAAKAAFFYLPLLAAPFVWRALRVGGSRATAVLAVALAVVLAAAPVPLTAVARD